MRSVVWTHYIDRVREARRGWPCDDEGFGGENSSYKHDRGRDQRRRNRVQGEKDRRENSKFISRVHEHQSAQVLDPAIALPWQRLVQ